MTTSPTQSEWLEFSVVCICGREQNILVTSGERVRDWPVVRIPVATRYAREIQRAFFALWGLWIYILDFVVVRPSAQTWVIAQPITKYELPQGLNLASQFELVGDGQYVLRCWLEREPIYATQRLAWIHEAIDWVQACTATAVSRRCEIEQFNAGSGFVLLRIPLENKSSVWLKATGGGSLHELSLTRTLADLAPGSVPPLLCQRSDWNAWLMLDGGSPIEIDSKHSRGQHQWEPVVAAMARLQMSSIGNGVSLIQAGAQDHGVRALAEQTGSLFEYLEWSMSLQESTKAPVLDREQLQAIRHEFINQLERVEALGLPDTIVHGDLNAGNILLDCGLCRFTDWCEGYVGSPLIFLQRLLLLVRAHGTGEDLTERSLIESYMDHWAATSWQRTLIVGMRYMPILSIASALYGRVGWWKTEHANNPQRQSYARMLVRRLDQEIRILRTKGSTC